MTANDSRPHILLIISRGEAVRNFLYSDTLKILHEKARLTLLSVLDDERFTNRFAPLVDEIIPLKQFSEKKFLKFFRTLVHDAHFRWLWSGVAKNRWETDDYAARSSVQKSLKRLLTKIVVFPIANRPALKILTKLERWLSFVLRPTRQFDEIFKTRKPDLVFNCSHIHGPAGELPAKVARKLGIPTAGFIFSWDNLTSRSRIFVPYDYFFVWNDNMRNELLKFYDDIPPERVFVTGTPQFDFHFKPEYSLSREALADRIGFDADRPFILYTTGVDRHFPEEYKHVRKIISILEELKLDPKPQLVVRIYVKGTSPEMVELSKQGQKDVFWPAVAWDRKWFTPLYEDLEIYTSLIHHACLSINAASTVSLEFIMHDKPVINIGFDPPGSSLPHHLRWSRHINFDHYRHVAASGAVAVAESVSELKQMITEALTNPGKQSAKRAEFTKRFFGSYLDGHAAERIADRLIILASGD